ncbi:hypothetical protein COT42_07965 [Candidatus Saganbacteria bacterium CG08_land_8_20_14_0_20_45_16]|uniref:NADP-dependent oxidoreductase domain-containing protein n=1 Tax=Candidatus Saganbacteria bacterium CG08_land_8_20_14_0_20_45_16 TaxID=2014293 RepID=A0A2H0XU68_UNCSA|nr:MAG: hypothetical protein COT42_07965 [Candidatus Saganbacteria bacterium CG08_land_8_20_14_0_20_45_16]
MAKVKQLAEIAQEIAATLPQLALAWCLKNPHVSTVIIGASSVEQLKENLQAAEIKNKLSQQILAKIATIIK